MLESDTWGRRTSMSESRIEIQPKPLTILNVVMIIFGSVLYAGSVNLFLQPLQLYAGGIPGLSQVIRTLCLPDTGTIDAAGIINFCFNIPLFILAYRSMNKKLLIGTLISVVIQTIVFTLVKIPSVPVIDDKLAAIMIAGLVGGYGCGMILSNSGTGGGLDLLGVFYVQELCLVHGRQAQHLYSMPCCIRYVPCSSMSRRHCILFSSLPSSHSQLTVSIIRTLKWN
jgi:hypothetical protein